MYLLGSETRLQATQTKTDSTGTIVITTDLPFVTAKSRVTTRPAPFLVDTGNLISSGATRCLRETDIRNGNRGLARMTTPIVAALPGVGAVAIKGAIVYTGASCVSSNSRTRVEQLLICMVWWGNIYKQREKVCRHLHT